MGQKEAGSKWEAKKRDESEPASGASMQCTLMLPTVNKKSSSCETPFVNYNN